MKTYRGIPIMTKADRRRKQQEKRKICKEQGICTMCGVRPARSSKTKCQECSDKTYTQKLGEDGRYKPEVKEKQNRWMRGNYRKRKTLIDNYKLERGCVDCGYADDPVALDFDHLPQYEKHNGIIVMLGNHSSMEKIIDEMNKCEIRCANCHRIRTWRGITNDCE